MTQPIRTKEKYFNQNKKIYLYQLNNEETFDKKKQFSKYACLCAECKTYLTTNVKQNEVNQLLWPSFVYCFLRDTNWNENAWKVLTLEWRKFWRAICSEIRNSNLHKESTNPQVRYIFRYVFRIRTRKDKITARD